MSYIYIFIYYIMMYSVCQLNLIKLMNPENYFGFFDTKSACNINVHLSIFINDRSFTYDHRNETWRDLHFLLIFVMCIYL